MKTDRELSAQYVEAHSNDAFSELVRRHTGEVFSSALRQVNRIDLARDVTQAVFIILSKQGKKMKKLQPVKKMGKLQMVEREAS